MATPGQAVPGTVVSPGSLTSPGGAQGTVGVIGPQGVQGPVGPTGPPAVTATSGNFTVPNIGATTTVTVLDASWIVQGQIVYIANAGGGSLAGALQVTAKTGNQLTLLNPATVSTLPPADSTQPGLLNQLSGNTSDFVDGTNTCQPIAPVIWSARLRSYNAIGNPTFEIDQRNVGAALLNVSTQFSQDRWQVLRSGTMGINTQQAGLGFAVGQGVSVPGTNFVISQNCLRISVNTAQASMGAGDYLILQQQVEGIYWRELMNDVHSLQLLVRPSVAGLRFGVALNDPGTTLRSLTKLSPALSANVWTLVQFPNLPVWPSGGNFTSAFGNSSYFLRIMLACGSSNMSPANDVWQNANVLGAPGMSNFAATLNATFDIAFVQHEPGPLCSTLIDKPFSQNYDECLRYYAKSYGYTVAPGATGYPAAATFFAPATTNANGPVIWPKRMAKAPTVAIYSPNSGAANTVYNVGSATNVAVTGTLYISDVGFLQIGGTFVTANQYLGQWTADTGW